MSKKSKLLQLSADNVDNYEKMSLGALREIITLAKIKNREIKIRQTNKITKPELICFLRSITRITKQRYFVVSRLKIFDDTFFIEIGNLERITELVLIKTTENYEYYFSEEENNDEKDHSYNICYNKTEERWYSVPENLKINRERYDSVRNWILEDHFERWYWKIFMIKELIEIRDIITILANVLVEFFQKNSVLTLCNFFKSYSGKLIRVSNIRNAF